MARIVGIAIGAALGLVFWSVVDALIDAATRDHHS